MANEALSALSKEQLIDLITLYSRNWLAMDGEWLQSIERKYGMEEAMLHDAAAWERYTVTEARRIRAFLGLPEHPGLEGLAAALRLRFYANINRDCIEIQGNTLIYTSIDCKVQRDRETKGMPYHPCKAVGLIEYAGFAKTIDDRIRCECISCYPEITDSGCCCKWKFTLHS